MSGVARYGRRLLPVPNWKNERSTLRPTSSPLTGSLAITLTKFVSFQILQGAFIDNELTTLCFSFWCSQLTPWIPYIAARLDSIITVI